MTRTWIQQCVPPALRRAGNRLLGRALRFSGPYPDWQAAVADTTGYDDAAILQRVVAATRTALQHPHLFEQDGFLKTRPAPPSHALAALLSAAARDGGRLHVLDFGGGLASHYLRWRPWLERIDDLRWVVVEQPSFVDEGTSLYPDLPRVRFVSTIDQAGAMRPNAILASSVLQYLPRPLDALSTLAGLGAGTIVLDRTAFARDDRARVIAQHVPAANGAASYPMWMLSRSQVAAELVTTHHEIFDFTADDHPIRVSGTRVDFGGSVWEIRP